MIGATVGFIPMLVSFSPFDVQTAIRHQFLGQLIHWDYPNFELPAQPTETQHRDAAIRDGLAELMESVKRQGPLHMGIDGVRRQVALCFFGELYNKGAYMGRHCMFETVIDSLDGSIGHLLFVSQSIGPTPVQPWEPGLRDQDDPTKMMVWVTKLGEGTGMEGNLVDLVRTTIPNVSHVTVALKR